MVDVDDDNRIRWKDGAVFTTLVDLLSYRPNGPLASMVYADGYTQTRTHDLSYRLTGITDANGGTVHRRCCVTHA